MAGFWRSHPVQLERVTRLAADELHAVADAMKAAALFDLTGRVAVVTGASSGIGRAIAAALADAGARIVLVARRANALEAACAEIKRAGGEASILPCDLADREALMACAESASHPFGPP